jgi:hypothetical protein
VNPLRWLRGWRYHFANQADIEPADAQWLRDLLTGAADRVEPDPGGLDAIRARLGHDTYAWGPDVTQPDLGVAAGLPRPYVPEPLPSPVPLVAGEGRPTAAELGTAFMGGLEEHMAREAPGMWAEWYAEYATLRWREFMAQWFGAR